MFVAGLEDRVLVPVVRVALVELRAVHARDERARGGVDDRGRVDAARVVDVVEEAREVHARAVVRREHVDRREVDRHLPLLVGRAVGERDPADALRDDRLQRGAAGDAVEAADHIQPVAVDRDLAHERPGGVEAGDRDERREARTRPGRWSGRARRGRRCSARRSRS